MKAFLAALQFLTIVPVGMEATAEDRQKSLKYFPLIGLLIGICMAVLDKVFACVFPPLTVAALDTVLFIIVSGGLHADGLADTADGFFSHRSQDEMLSIMKDSRMGAMGGVTVVCVLLLKFGALSSLSPSNRWSALLLAPLAGRCSIMWMMHALPYVRLKGLPRDFQGESNHALWALCSLCGCAFLLYSWKGIVIAVVVCMGSLVFCRYSRQKIGGYTGDTLGAICELSETLSLLMIVAYACRVSYG